MKTLKVLIVDDERYSRNELSHLLSCYENIEIVGEADNGESAIMKSIQLQPDVVFLDIEMPQLNGMEAASSLKELKKKPLIVFATAYPDFAVVAFRHEAVDYLVKPYDEVQLKETILRLEKLLLFTPTTEELPSLNKLAIEGDEEINYIDPKHVMYIYREERYTRLVLEDREFETKSPLKEFETRLKDYSFFRIHKSYLVNLSYVAKLIPWFNGAYHLELKGKKELLSVSRNYVKGLRTRLEL
ncbi:LytR/AlgR family response regulator transcription factor [Litchfieldia salsa]|uniref:Two component transcriptional regulator, LytTR family n=1 Tax=Litchfieldia salsa TaxID=930152 RepID=A0A1H0RUQ5_9BACI|nr:LytTR family DNA-binding domain-containing protein [Litchfieldia salsa]SDP33140.1 two component transcriptional regulator, LytTR family [Litchfieldia salsa]